MQPIIRSDVMYVYKEEAPNNISDLIQGSTCRFYKGATVDDLQQIKQTIDSYIEFLNTKEVKEDE